MRPGFSEVFSWDEDPPTGRPSVRLSANTELFDDDAVARDVCLDQVLEKTTALTHEKRSLDASVQLEAAYGP